MKIGPELPSPVVKVGPAFAYANGLLGVTLPVKKLSKSKPSGIGKELAEALGAFPVAVMITWLGSESLIVSRIWA